MQDTVAEMAKDLRVRKSGEAATTAEELYQFVKRVRSGQRVDNSELIRFAKLFNDELTLDNLERVRAVCAAVCCFLCYLAVAPTPSRRTHLTLITTMLLGPASANDHLRYAISAVVM